MSSVTPDRAPPEFEAATQVLVVSDSARSRDFYSGAPTLDKPTVRFVAPADPDTSLTTSPSGWGTVGPSTSC